MNRIIPEIGLNWMNRMPALVLLGRKWLIGSDDMVFPALFEIVVRVIWLILISIVCNRYYSWTLNCTLGGVYVRAYLIGMLVVLSLVIFVLILLVNRSAQGAIWDTEKRRWVGPLLIVKSKPTIVKGDNCCLCNFAAVRYISQLQSKDILYSSFRNHIFEEVFSRRFCKTRLFMPGHILHITRKKKTKEERKAAKKLRIENGDDYEMRWASPEDFNEMRIMPRMLLDHLPENVLKTIDAVLDCQQTEIGLDVAEITII
ncbi:hypothetical protein V9T40_002468 [Parthenolecanium corni]|uniref:Uncharacterized protein n=1 Tax=Parthenolecanium corni TaxID=536013 RepID=A0AAN9TGR7_9HEMI